MVASVSLGATPDCASMAAAARRMPEYQLSSGAKVDSASCVAVDTPATYTGRVGASAARSARVTISAMPPSLIRQ